MSEEWGPVIEHDGCGCPCVGEFVWVQRKDGSTQKSIATGKYNDGGSCWDWGSTSEHWAPKHILRYRIRKPRGLAALEDLLADLPESVDA